MRFGDIDNTSNTQPEPMTNTPSTDTDIDELLLGLLDFSPARFQRQMKDGTIKQLSGMDVFNEAKAAIVKKLNAARIDELQKVLKHCPMPTLSYEDIKDRIKALQATKEGK